MNKEQIAFYFAQVGSPLEIAIKDNEPLQKQIIEMIEACKKMVVAEERERVRGEIEKLYEEFSVHPNENDREYMVQRFRLFTDKILSSLPLTNIDI